MASLLTVQEHLFCYHHSELKDLLWLMLTVVQES